MSAESLYSIPVRSIQGTEATLEPYKGKVLVVVNVASSCGFTPQYRGLQDLYRRYRAHGLEILGFPCNQFGDQETGTEAEIQTFCERDFGVSFPLFSKIEVNGSGAHPLFKLLKSEAKGLLGSEAIKWNFTKFLVARDGRVLKRYAPQTAPEALEADILEALEALEALGPGAR